MDNNLNSIQFNTTYTPPDFLKNQSVDEIHKRMLNNLPDGIDKSELQIPWDFTRPTAIEKAELIQFGLNETIKLIFPQWAYDEYLDLHAEMIGLKRKESNKATGILNVTAREGTIIPKGFIFATPATNSPSILFEATQTTTINETGIATIKIQAVEGGRLSNVTNDTILLMLKPIAGVTSVTNLEPTTGGSQIEDDESLRVRVLYALHKGISYVGNDADYLSWATAVAGVGKAFVIPEWDGPGTVKVVVVDEEGLPANQQIVEAVYSHIVSPKDRIKRLAPIGATVTIVPPTIVNITIQATIMLKEEADVDTVKKKFMRNIDSYYMKATNDGAVKYVYVGSILAQTEGVYDYEKLYVNGGEDNIPISMEQFPLTSEVLLDVKSRI